MKRILIIAALMLAATSCGRPPDASATARSAIDPCKLVMADEASAAIGEQVGAAKRENNNPDLLCSYANDATGHSVSVTINKGKGAKNAFKGVNSFVAHDTNMDDLGDEAFISKTRAIHVLIGDAYLAIKITDDSPLAMPKIEGLHQAAGSTELPQATRDKLTAMARKAISRL